jgi:signal peptidase II
VNALVQPKNLIFLAVTLLGTIADQATKAWVVANVELHRGEVDIIPGFLSIVHERNDGAAFSSFEGWQGLFIIFTIIAVGVLADLQRKLRPEAWSMAATLGLILSGAFGNFIDRVRFGYVTDFIRVYTDNPDWSAWLISKIGTNTYPIFNIADSSILVGVILFLLISTFGDETDIDVTEDVPIPSSDAPEPEPEPDPEPAST